MADDAQGKVKHRGSCLGKLVALFAFGGVAGLGAAVFFIAKPQDLSGIKGRGPAAEKARDLRVVLQKATDGGFPVTLTEEEINRYLKQTLAAKQGGLLAQAVSFEGVCVRLEEGRAEVVMERSIMGRPMTLSMYLRIEQTLDVHGRPEGTAQLEGGPFFPEIPRLEHLVKGGRFGSLVLPQGFLTLVLPAYKDLAAHFYVPEGGNEAPKELNLIEEMSRITIAKGKLVLDPRADGGGGLELPGPGGTF